MTISDSKYRATKSEDCKANDAELEAYMTQDSFGRLQVWGRWKTRKKACEADITKI
jgi:hypothetical protein